MAHFHMAMETDQGQHIKETIKGLLRNHESPLMWFSLVIVITRRVVVYVNIAFMKELKLEEWYNCFFLSFSQGCEHKVECLMFSSF